MSHAFLTMEEKCISKALCLLLLIMSVITHVFQSASTNADTLLTGDLIESSS